MEMYYILITSLIVLFYSRFQTVLYLGWIAALLTICGCIFANYPLQQLDRTASSVLNGLYYAIPRIAWPTALSFIIFACHFGYGGPINWFLSLTQWLPISRLTYSMYLIHVLVVAYFSRQNRTSTYFSDLTMVLKSKY